MKKELTLKVIEQSGIYKLAGIPQDIKFSDENPNPYDYETSEKFQIVAAAEITGEELEELGYEVSLKWEAGQEPINLLSDWWV